MTSGLFAELENRGLVKQVTDPSLKKLIDGERLTLYCGFDPTSDSLHVGSLLPLLTLRRFQLAGHRVIAVIGGATGMIGDPSGKAQERLLLGPDALAHNVRGITQVISRFLETRGSNPAKILNNADWFKGVDYISFLRDIGKHFTINHMMAKESVRARLEDREHGISYTEFSYMLLQAYDFHELHRQEGCTLQIGGSDQWGNITAGCELIRRIAAASGRIAPEVHGMTHPLVMKADGTKFGKTEQGTVWLDAAKTSPYRLYQFFIQTADADTGTYLRYFTFLPIEEIEALEKSLQTAPEKREAQKALAREMTRLVHGDEAFLQAEAASSALFGEEIKKLDRQTFLDVMSDAPSSQLPAAQIQSGISLIDLLVQSGLSSSKGAARKDVTSGGIYLNNERTSDAAFTVNAQHLIANEFIVLRKGKRNYHLIRIEK